METLNRKITKNSLADEVFAQLKSMVLSETWQAGEKIPSEQTLSNMFGVSRLTVRIAIEKLNALQILETKVGEGTYVRPFDFKAYISEIDDLMLSDITIINGVSAYRTAIELCAVEQLMKQDESIQLDDLFDLCKKMEELSLAIPVDFSSPDVISVIDQYVTYDYKFHCKICELSKNQLLFYSYLMARSPIMHYLTLILKKRITEFIRDHPAENHVGFEDFYNTSLGQRLHRSILLSIQNKDYELCQLIHKRMHNYSIDSAELLSYEKNKI